MRAWWTSSSPLTVLLSELPGEITLAWKALRRRGRAWIAAATASLARLDPGLVADLRRLGVGASRS
jgi:hypothetical protein